ncbi:hypothetical protein L873DRAFT_1819326 [Choiromyces venosus 120613-1]|uniref:Uncharacterized protein n=1 Tax=Choiromyces venosus 120613-1 TaxID=1336337 RepID=A0A3N4J2P3_9PEZI|nr:hypothetical protein L873DRAFT_1819326 [Choiromyces venosus 120613-1]
MVDPDAPSHQTPARRNIRQLLASDLTLVGASKFVRNALTLSNSTFDTPAANSYRPLSPLMGPRIDISSFCIVSQSHSIIAF